MTDARWEFWIDVGGTFADCIAISPGGRFETCKMLSSGVVKGKIDSLHSKMSFFDASRLGDPVDFWNGYRLRFMDSDGEVLEENRVQSFDPEKKVIALEHSVSEKISVRSPYELFSEEEAPVLAIRKILRLKLGDPIPEVVVKLGTTKGTNALLTRTGARTAFVTTRGFRDVLLIGNQDRPRLFDLFIQKPDALFEKVVEIDERMDARGRPLEAPSPKQIRKSLLPLREMNIESVAICLLHSFANDRHEFMVEEIARELGFEEISTSSKLAPLIKIVSRGDTTVMDAYLNPILRSYVDDLRKSIPGGTLKIMTSAGGLVDGDSFVGKDSILSGPAGGVVGFSSIAKAAGFKKSIGFDMGGTSTDVSRFDGKYELEFETKKDGVRIVSPMMSIETVAAGGGSLCQFDGVKLQVGPDSAGAQPGPACYGRGGPLTVTDMNLFLGKIVAERFPFPLDRETVEKKLRTQCEEIALSPMGKRYRPEELAAGYLQIANANMVRAIRKISLSKGYHPSEYVLTCFGGAAAQHACAVAESLGIGSILVHPYAGILSAYGIGMADVRRFGQKSVLEILEDRTLSEMEESFRQLEKQAIEEVIEEGVAESHIDKSIRSLDLRYRGVDSSLNVVLSEDLVKGNPSVIDYYEELHRQQFGYTHDGREVEIVALRVEVVGKIEPIEFPKQPMTERFPNRSSFTKTWFEDRWFETDVFFGADLQPGDRLTGPAIVCEETSTIVIEPGYEAKILSRGEFLITSGLPNAQHTSNKPANEKLTADPIRLEVFNNLFASVAEQMGVTLQKTSISTNIKERLDFSCAIFDRQGDLVVNAPHIPVHLGAMSETVKRVIVENREISCDDVIVTNDPYRGGSHLPDITVISPVHGPAGEIVFFTASRAHHAEIGGIVPGSMPPFSKNLAEEGVLIRNFKLVDRGVSREKELRMLLLSGKYPTRSVEDNLADISAQVAANRLGTSLLQEMIEHFSLRVVLAYMGFIQRAASQKMRMALDAMTDGEYRFEDFLDDGSAIRVKITVAGERAKVDFTGTGPVLKTNLNANSAIVSAAVLYVFRCLIQEDIPLNSGVLEPIEIVLPQCLLNPTEKDSPEDCAAIVGGNVETSQRVVDTLLGALGIAAASQGTMNNLTFGDSTFGYYETICGGSGASVERNRKDEFGNPIFHPGTDSVHTHMTNTRLTDVEILERRYPVLIKEFSIRKGSGGKGRFCGGDGIVRTIEFLKPLTVSMLSQRRGQFTPFGLQGGDSGKSGENLLLRAEASEPQNLGGCFSISVDPGDTLTIHSPGGGAFGQSSD